MIDKTKPRKSREPVDKRFNAYLKRLRIEAKISTAALAQMLNIHRNSQLNYEKSRDPNIDYLLAFSSKVKVSFWKLICQRVALSKAPKEMIEQALYEIGPFYLDAPQPNETAERKNSYVFEPKTSINHSKNGETIEVLLQQLYRQYGHNPHLRIYQQVGMSMAPKIMAGDYLLIDTQDTQLEDGSIYLIELEDQRVARRIQLETNRQIIIASDNDRFAPLLLNFDQRRALKVIGKLKLILGKA